MKIKKGDNVVVIAGKSRGTTGKVELVLAKKNMLVIDGVNVVKKHRRATGQASRKGQIVEKSMPIHISNVMLADPKGGKPTRVRIERRDGARERVAVKSKAKIS